MIADLKPYPEYKESGSRWLGGGAFALGGAQSSHAHPAIETSAIAADLPLLSSRGRKGSFVRSL